jgi:hypothetical protein
VQLPLLLIPEAHHNLDIKRDLNVQGARLTEAQPAPLIDSQGLAMGIPVGEKPLLLCSCQDVVHHAPPLWALISYCKPQSIHSCIAN